MTEDNRTAISISSHPISKTSRNQMDAELIQCFTPVSSFSRTGSTASEMESFLSSYQFSKKTKSSVDNKLKDIESERFVLFETHGPTVFSPEDFSNHDEFFSLPSVPSLSQKAEITSSNIKEATSLLSIHMEQYELNTVHFTISNKIDTQEKHHQFTLKSPEPQTHIRTAVNSDQEDSEDDFFESACTLVNKTITDNHERPSVLNNLFSRPLKIPSKEDLE